MPEQLIKAWYLANTTIRNPQRLKEGLRLLVDSPLHGNLVGRIREQQFATLLNEAGIVNVKRLRDNSVNEKDASDVGRKWRAAMMQMGFITPGPDLSQRPYTVTPNGKRLINSNTLPEEQECFLRALLAIQLPSQVDKYIEVPAFSPLRIVLYILRGLEEATFDASISQDEMAFIIQLVTNLEDVDKAIHEIVMFREELKKAARSKIYRKDFRELISSRIKSQKEATIFTYADANFRYLKLTGLFSDIGRRLRLTEYKQTIINLILSTPFTPIPSDQYLEVLWKGASLPTDHAKAAIEAITTTADILRAKSVTEKTESLKQLELIPDLTQVEQADLSNLRLKLEDDLLKLLETDYAEQQKNQGDNIVQYLRALINPDRRLIPDLEAPAYLEWTLWRAFLAINSLVNKPWNARRFKIDQDFKPVSPAPGGGPDMIFEFEDYALIVEVTLTTSSRQEAAEGEPVRRHIADLVDIYEQQGKRVYGLFLANKIDTNTAETFRVGCWYRANDTRMELQIVPLTLRDFTDLFDVALQKMSRLDYQTMERVIIQCLNAKEDSDAPRWKSQISECISFTIRQLENAKV